MSYYSWGVQIIGLIGWILIVSLAAALGARASVQAGQFYGELHRPLWAPPSWIFAPVWTVLYLLMAISAWLIWRVNGFYAAQAALTLFLIQLAFNALWSWLFFHWRKGALAFVDILILWTLIVGAMAAFWRIRPLAAALLVPYLLWVSFAAVLNFSLWQRNQPILDPKP